MHSDYLWDQAKRTHLLELLASMYAIIADLSGELIELELGPRSMDETEARSYRAATLSMDLLADWKMAHPMVVDIYDDGSPAPIG